MPYVVIPQSNYILNGYNNTLLMTYQGSLQTFTIPQGNYNANTMLAYLQSILTTANGWTVSYSSTTNVFTFLNSSFAFTLNQGSGIDYVLGFSESVSSTYIGGFNRVDCPRSFNFLPIPRYIVHCNLLNDGVLLSTNGTMGCSDIIASIPNISKPSGQLVYENIGSEFLVKAHNFGNILLTITDDNNREIDFRGISSYMVLKFNIFRRSIKKPMKFEHLVHHINKIKVEDLPVAEDEEEQVGLE